MFHRPHLHGALWHGTLQVPSTRVARPPGRVGLAGGDPQGAGAISLCSTPTEYSCKSSVKLDFRERVVAVGEGPSALVLWGR